MGKWTSLVVGYRIGASQARRTSLRSAWPIHCRSRCCISGDMSAQSGCDGILRRGARTNNSNTKSGSPYRLQEWLDAGMGACHLRRSDVRARVERSLLHFDGKRYDIDAFVLMPNHVHAVIAPTHGYDLSMILRGIKGVSANECNKLLGRKSTFWMDESYDHIVRDANELVGFRNYITANPEKAGLKPDEYSLQIRNALAI
jgi:REP element-mobilizing transposase RayT